MPLPKREKWKLEYLYPPFFIQQLGVFSVEKLGAEKVHEFILAIPDHFSFFEINLNVHNYCSLKNIRITELVTYELDLIQSYEQNRKKYAENTSRNLKKAEKNNFKINSNTDPKKIIELFRNNRGKEIKNLQEADYLKLENIIKACVVRDMGQVWGVELNGKLCAGGFFVDSNGKAIFLFSGANKTSRETGAMFYLIDRFIEQNSQRNLILDFEGSMDKNLAKFYASFASKKCTYLQLRSNRLPWYIKWLKK